MKWIVCFLFAVFGWGIGFAMADEEADQQWGKEWKSVNQRMNSGEMDSTAIQDLLNLIPSTPASFRKKAPAKGESDIEEIKRLLVQLNAPKPEPGLSPIPLEASGGLKAQEEAALKESGEPTPEMFDEELKFPRVRPSSQPSSAPAQRVLPLPSPKASPSPKAVKR